MKEIKALTGARAAAAGSVLLFHTYWALKIFNGTDPNLVVSSTAKYGWVGVDLFFVLSGFVLARSLFIAQLKGGMSWREFMLRRWLRTAPAFYASILLGLVVLGNVPFLWHHPSMLVSHLLYLQTMDVQTVTAVNICFWSLAVEFQVYLLLPFLVKTVARRPVLSVVVTGALAVLWPALLIRNGHPLYNYWVITQAVPFLFHFCLGVLAFQVSNRGWRIPVRPAVVVPATLLLLTATTWLIEPPTGPRPLSDHVFLTLQRIPAALAFFVLVFELATTEGWATRLFASRPFVSGGKISYSFYLIHLPIVQTIPKLVPEVLAHGYLVFTLATAIPCVLAATLLYWLVERPSLNWKVRLATNAPGPLGPLIVPPLPVSASVVPAGVVAAPAAAVN